MVTENVDIRFRSSGTRTVKRNIDDIGRVSNEAARQINILQRAIFVIGGAGVVRSLSRQLDLLTNYENRLRLTATSARNLEEVQSRLFSIANRSRTSFEAVAEIYSRTALSVRELGISQAETARFTESLAKASILSGASAREANAALIQLGQGLASNRLNGDELRSVLEQLPFVADVIAKQLGVTRGELRQFGREGKITADVVLEAFRNAADEIDKAFANTNSTIGQAISVAGNNLLKFIDALDDASGFSFKVADAIITLSENIDILTIGVVGLAAAFAATRLTTFISGLTQAGIAALQFNTQVRNGEVVLLNSARAEQLRAQSILASRNAEVSRTAAQVTAIRQNIDQLNQNKQLIAQQRARALAQVELQRGIATSTGRTEGLVKAQRELNNSTKARIVTDRALRTSYTELQAANAAQVAASNAATGAAQRATVANRAASGVLARLAVAAPLAARAVSGVAFAFNALTAAVLANPLGAAITAFTAISIALSVTEQRSERIIRLNDTVEDSVNKIKTAYDSVSGALDQVADKVEGITLTQALQTSAEASKVLERDIRVLAFRSDRLAEGLRGAFGTTPKEIREARDEIKDLAETLRQEGAGGLEDFREGLDSIGQNLTGRGRARIAALLEISDTTLTLAESAEKAEAIVRLLGGSATEADRALLGLGEGSSGRIGELAGEAELLSNNFQTATDSITDLQSTIDNLQLSNVGLAAQNAALSAGATIRESEAAAAIAEEKARLAVALASEEAVVRAAARAELEAFVKAQEQGVALSDENQRLLKIAADNARELEGNSNGATGALNGAAAAAAAVASNLQAAANAIAAVSAAAANLDISSVGLEAQNVALSRGADSLAARAAGQIAQRRAELSDALGPNSPDGVRANAQRELESYTQAVERNTAAQRTNLELIRNANSVRSGGGGGGGGGGSSTSFGTIISDLEKQVELLRSSSQERRYSNDILSVEKELKRSLTETEKELLSQRLQSAEVAQREVELLESIQGPREKAQVDLEAINNLYEQGRLGLEEYAQALRTVQAEADRVSDTVFGGFRAAISDSIKSTGELGDALGNSLVGAVDSAADAIATFVTTGKFDFNSFARSVIADIVKIIAKQQLLRALGFVLGVPTGGAGGSGLLGFNSGGTILPSGPGNTDSQVVTFNKRPDERVDILTPAQQANQQKALNQGRDARNRGEDSPTIVMNIQTRDAESFKRAETQIAAQAGRFIQRGRRST